ncbi:MBL fold metallo-hydrolase [Pseudoroseicyclus tamaricis]|uniref:MBL fold metallo-hydrolase n=1 Tax=Pseudoroseicyclus tamaricis TaxID=2705421 RepID=A0A6B2JH91_9RHOB|nr:MBL fold metallo-hydrolase [Pseudoroseicyclus tamaricis]NDV00593.1 MBL fold metallo-hydrolase [Pseudoroseicyclus tamaricis]
MSAPALPEPVAPGVMRLLAPNPSPMTFRGTNSYLVGDTRLAVIDPGPDLPAHLEALLAAIAGRPVDAILVTHAHRDHSALSPSLAAATGAPVLAYGPASAGRSPVMARLAAEGLTAGGVDEAFRPDRRLTDGEAISGPGWSLETLWTPGHMGNHLSFRLDDIIFTGDVAMGWASSIVAPPDGDVSQFLASCRRLCALSPRRLLPGHGEPVEKPAERLSWLIRHRERRAAQILSALSDGPLTVDDLTTRLYGDMAWSLRAAAAQNVFAHLIDLVEKEVVATMPRLASDARFQCR